MCNFKNFLQNIACPWQAAYHFHAAFLALPLIGEQPGQILHLFDIIFHHDRLEMAEKSTIVLREVSLREDLAEESTVH